MNAWDAMWTSKFFFFAADNIESHFVSILSVRSTPLRADFINQNRWRLIPINRLFTGIEY